MRRTKKFEAEGGFTLMELVIVLAILAILAALAVPQFGKVMENSAAKSDNVNVMLVETAVEVYKADLEKLPEVTGDDASAHFNSLVTLLNTEGYLKNSAIKAQASGKSFGYDKDTGKVSIISSETDMEKNP